jgi:hypothetical protein
VNFLVNDDVYFNDNKFLFWWYGGFELRALHLLGKQPHPLVLSLFSDRVSP